MNYSDLILCWPSKGPVHLAKLNSVLALLGYSVVKKLHQFEYELPIGKLATSAVVASDAVMMVMNTNTLGELLKTN